MQGHVTGGTPYLTKVGRFDVDVAIEGKVLLVRQQDRPGLIASVATKLAADEINVSFMTVGRLDKGSDAIMCIGVDSDPSQKVRSVCMAHVVPHLHESFSCTALHSSRLSKDPLACYCGTLVWRVHFRSVFSIPSPQCHTVCS